MRSTTDMLGGVLLGAGLMYYLDPERGRRRRAVLRDQFVHMTHDADEALDTAARDLRNRTMGVAAEARSRFRRDDASPSVVEARVRSQLGRLVSHPGAIHVMAEEDGTVTLSGPVLAHELDRLLAGVRGVKGVSEVVNRLEPHDSPGDVPGLQGQVRRPQPRLDLLQENWAPATRMLMGMLGGALVLRGMRGGGIASPLLTMGGLGVLARALTNTEMTRLLGVDSGRRAVDLHKIITIHAPVEQVFSFWSNYENFPEFMSHLREVRHTGAERSHWVAEGPGGMPFEWDAETTLFEENRVIAWKSIGSPPVENAGIIRFQEEGDGATRVDIRLSYNPPAGVLGHAVASLLGSDPKRLIDDDLVRMKSLLEEGKTTAHHRTVRRDQVEGAMEEEHAGNR